jgi:hypothetical protein
MESLETTTSLLTPKACANFSPGLERSNNPGNSNKTRIKTLKAFAGRLTLSGLKRNLFSVFPGFSLRSNPGLKLANAFGVFPEDKQT